MSCIDAQAVSSFRCIVYDLRVKSNLGENLIPSGLLSLVSVASLWLVMMSLHQIVFMVVWQVGWDVVSSIPLQMVRITCCISVLVRTVVVLILGREGVCRCLGRM